jgi:predicted acylesterase/phospholipase RssA
MSPLDNDYGTAIILQGGGALGAYELGVLKALYETRPGFKPSVVTGISIGAITAAVLTGAKGDPIQALDRLWREKLTVLPLPPLFPSAYQQFASALVPDEFEKNLAAWGNPGMYRPRLDYAYAPWRRTSIYDLAPLRQTLTEMVDLEKLNNGGIRVAVGATNVGTSDIRYFDNDRVWLSYENVMASGSLPPGFPMTQVDGDYYWDGGLFENTPLSPALNRLEELDKEKRELIVVELFPRQSPIPGDMADVVNRMLQLQYTNRLKLDGKFFEKFNNYIELVEEIDSTLEGDHPVRQTEGYKELQKYKRIDAASVICAHLPPELSNASDFSKASIEGRIDAGYRDAIEQKIEEYTPAEEQIAKLTS